TAPGMQLREIPIPPHSTAFTFRDDQIDAVGRTTGAQLVRSIRLFNQDPERRRSIALIAVFHNFGDKEFPLSIVKSHPFRPADANQIIMDGGYVWNTPPGYQSPRFG